MRTTVKNIMDDTLSDLRRVRPPIPDNKISEMIAEEIKRFNYDSNDLAIYLYEKGLPALPPNVKGSSHWREAG